MIKMDIPKPLKSRPLGPKEAPKNALNLQSRFRGRDRLDAGPHGGGDTWGEEGLSLSLARD